MKQLVQRAAARDDDTTGEADGLTGITDEMTDERAGAMRQKNMIWLFSQLFDDIVTSDLEFIFKINANN